MGELIDGVWHHSGIDAILKNGGMRRPPSTFRNWITPEGEFPPRRVDIICMSRCGLPLGASDADPAQAEGLVGHRRRFSNALADGGRGLDL